MAMDFPATPVNGQTYLAPNGLQYVYNATTGWTLNLFRYGQVQANSTAIAGQTSFPVPGGYAPGLVQVYKNGLKLINAIDVTVTSGTSVVLGTGATAGDKIEIIGLQAFSIAAGYMLGAIQLLTAASGTYTPPNGCRALIVELLGPGGSAGGCPLTGAGEAAVSSGGSSGAYCQKFITSLLSSYAYVNGVGGAAPSAGANAGNPGSAATTFGSAFLSAGPGAGGLAGTAGTTFLATDGVAGGTASGGDINLSGGASVRAVALSGNVLVMPRGGIVPALFPSTPLLTLNANGVVPSDYGNGGNGCALTQSTSAKAGAAGRNGVIRIQELF